MLIAVTTALNEVQNQQDSNMSLSNNEKERYNRHLIISEIGEKGQLKLKAAKVLVIGAGGLGSPLLMYLAGGGIGHIGIVDGDEVSLSNLQRQVLYKESEVGQSKSDLAAQKLKELNSDVELVSYPYFLDEDKADALIAEYDIVVGATDNFKSRYLLDTICKKQNKPFVNGAISEFSGQVGVFNYAGAPAYSDLFPEHPEEAKMPIGVMGVLPGVIGSMMAVEVVKIVTGIGEVLSGKLLSYDALANNVNVIDFSGLAR